MKKIWPFAIGAGVFLIFSTKSSAQNPSNGSNDLPEDGSDIMTRSTLDLPGAPIGVRNNNLLNIRPSTAYTWQGQIGTSQNFVRFKSQVWGVRAAIKNLHTYFHRDGLDTIAKIITRWAPPSDGNDTAAYIQFVADESNFGKNERLTFNQSTILDLIWAMSAMEVGAKWRVYPDLFNAAWSLAYPSGVGAIFPAIPNLFECNDGAFSTSSGRRACFRHGGLKTGLPIRAGSGGGSNLILINDVPIDKISTDTGVFQGREKKFSERSVENIVADVLAGEFVWENLDPITLFLHPDGRLLVLSGHSRFEAFRRLAADGRRADGKGFDRIPAKILRNVPIETAKRIALESNTLSTKETDIERAAFYRRKRQEGTAEKDLVANLKKNEGKNWVNIYAYTFLNPAGRVWSLLKQFGDAEDTSATLAKSLAKWIGAIRRAFPELTNAHEDEIYEWIFQQKGYGTGPGQVSNERDFADKLSNIIQKNTAFGRFESDKPLNILRAQLKSPAETELQQQIDETTRQIQDLQRVQTSKLRELNERKPSPAQTETVMQPIEARLRWLRLELVRLSNKKSEVAQYSRNEATLFGTRRNR